MYVRQLEDRHAHVIARNLGKQRHPLTAVCQRPRFPEQRTTLARRVDVIDREPRQDGIEPAPCRAFPRQPDNRQRVTAAAGPDSNEPIQQVPDLHPLPRLDAGSRGGFCYHKPLR